MEMYSTTYKTIRDTDPENPLVKAMDAEFKARLALDEAFRKLAQAKMQTMDAENAHYKKYFNLARAEFGDRPFTAAEFEKFTNSFISKHSVASMVAESKKDRNKYDPTKRTNKLLPSNFKDTGRHQKVEHFYLPCDATGKPIEGAEPVRMCSKGSKLYQFGE